MFFKRAPNHITDNKSNFAMAIPPSSALIQLMAFYASALALGAWLSKHGQARFNGHLLAGLVLGPVLLSPAQTLAYLTPIADLALFFLLFQAGLGMDPEPFLERPAASLVIGAAGFVLPLALGYGAGRVMGADPMVSLSLGLVAAMSVTAVGPRALSQLKICQNRTGHVVQGAALAGHYLSLAALSVWVVAASPQEIDFQASGLARAALPFALAWVMTRFVLEPVALKAGHQAEAYFCLCMAVLAVMAWAADLAGAVMITAAFLAGQVLGLETANREILEKAQARLQSMAGGFLVPVFFGVLGTQTDFSLSGAFWALAALLFVAILGGKVIGGVLAALACRRPRIDALATGLALAGGGTVPLAAAAALMAIGVPDTALASMAQCPLLGGRELAALAVAWVASAAAAPVLLRWLVAKTALSQEKAAFFRNLPSDPV